jgi:hypothetical protein
VIRREIPKFVLEGKNIYAPFLAKWILRREENEKTENQ